MYPSFGVNVALYISIHALREEGDAEQIGMEDAPENISIHALREEGDADHRRPAAYRADFYPRPPRGGRRQRLDFSTCKALFLSTPSARRATLS